VKQVKDVNTPVKTSGWRAEFFSQPVGTMQFFDELCRQIV
jgi:hypothetical protein